MATVIERLKEKKDELNKRLSGQYQGGSQRRESIQYRIKKIEELILVYQSTPNLINLKEAEETLNQQIGFAEWKKEILENLEIEQFCKQHNVRREPKILCLAGPPGTGKTTFAYLLAQVLKKKLFSISLGGLVENSFLMGASESSGGTEMGQLARALIEAKASSPVILLEEIDKVGSFKPFIRDCLITLLVPVQNQKVLDYYLGIELDLSQVIFIVTANDWKKIPDYLRSRMLIIELLGYNLEQKKVIANKIIQKQFAQSPVLDQNDFEIKPEALEKLINQTKEKGVRQLKSALDSIFNYYLLQLARQEKQGDKRSKIIITPNLMKQIITYNFVNVDNEGVEESLSEIQQIKREIKILQEQEKSRQVFWFIFFIISLIIGIIYGAFSLKNGEKKEKSP